MANYDDEDLEIEAIAKCAKALSRLDDDSKTRVIRYLLDKYGFIGQSYNSSYPSNQTVENEKKLLSVAQDNKVDVIHSENSSFENENIPSLYELITKKYTKNEMEILLIVLFCKTNNGTIPIDRSAIMDAYREQEIYTEVRNKNLSANLKKLIKQSYISAITKTKFGITEKGKLQVQLIIQGKSEAKAIKTRTIKRKVSTNDK